MMEISSSSIRQDIQQGKDVRYLLVDSVYNYMKDMHFYEK
jgi:nicotinate-nucleotide adenylyltransferase